MRKGRSGCCHRHRNKSKPYQFNQCSASCNIGAVAQSAPKERALDITKMCVCVRGHLSRIVKWPKGCWALRPTSAGVAARVELTWPCAAAIRTNVAGPVRIPRSPRVPVVEARAVLDVTQVHELVVVLRDVDPAFVVVAP
eukprot:1690756-Pyramimonas_sp.AAC.1